MLLSTPTAPGGDAAALPGALESPPLAASSREPTATAATALDVWREILAAHLAARPNAVTAAGDAYPETSHGDVRRAALVFSRELCRPRYDFARLGDTRAAWREALARIHVTAAHLPWDAPYPSNPQFWLSDTRALAQRLAAVDVRRNRLINAQPDGLVHAVSGGDPLTTYLDLRAYFFPRRLVRTDRGWRYPETTVGDVAQIVRIVDAEIARELHDARNPLVVELIEGRLAPWRAAASAVRAAVRVQPSDTPYADNLTLWRAYWRLSGSLAVAHEASAEDARNPLTYRVAS